MDYPVRYVRVCLGCDDREEYTMRWTRHIRRDPGFTYKEEESLCPPCRWKKRNFQWCFHCREREDEEENDRQDNRDEESGGGQESSAQNESDGSRGYGTAPESPSLADDRHGVELALS